jgi:phospholipid transport system substrate-binding protein
MFRFARLAVLAGCLLLAGLPVSHAATPREQIATLNATLLDVMKNADRLGYSGRYEKLQPVMTRLYDFALMSRIAVGAYWKGLAEDKRQRLIDAFTRMSIATYAARFDGFSGERFEIVSAEKSVRNTMLVKTRLIKSDGTPVALNYLTRPSGDDWRIIDVFLDARFSELARLRADYTAVIKRQGFDNLLATIEAKIDGLAKE